MTATASKLILTALVLLSTGAAADQRGGFVGPAFGQVAELSEQERAWFRDQWQRLPQEERDAMRRKLRQDWTDLPPEVRQQQRRELKDKLENRRDKHRPRELDRYEPETGYGQGYDSRYQDDYDERHRGRR